MTTIIDRPALPFDEGMKNQMREFVRLLTVEDSPPQLCTQSLEDCPKDPNDRKVKQIKFWLPDEEIPISQFFSLNQHGFFTNCCLNEFAPLEDGSYKKSAKQVSRVRGYAVDIDTYLPLNIISGAVATFRPTMAILSSSRQGAEQGAWEAKAHFYWLYRGMGMFAVPDLQKILNEFKDMQTYWAICVQEWLRTNGAPEAKCDLQLNTLSLALRMPGLYHQKNPQNVSLTTLWQVDEASVLTAPCLLTGEQKSVLKQHRAALAKELQAAQAAAGITPAGPAATRAAESPGAVVTPSGPVESAMLRYGDSSGKLTVYLDTAQGNRNQSLYHYIFQRLFCEKRLSRNEAYGAAWVENVAHNIPPLAEGEINVILDSAWTRYLEWLENKKTGVENLPVGSGVARALLLQESQAGMATANDLRENGIIIDAEVIDPETGEPAKKKSRGKRRSTTTLSTGTCKSKRQEKEDSGTNGVTQGRSFTTTEIDPDSLP